MAFTEDRLIDQLSNRSRVGFRVYHELAVYGNALDRIYSEIKNKFGAGIRASVGVVLLRTTQTEAPYQSYDLQANRIPSVLYGKEILLGMHRERGILSNPAGAVEEQESLWQALGRELREETGIAQNEVVLQQLLSVVLTQGKGTKNDPHSLGICYTGTMLKDHQFTETGDQELTDLRWYNPIEAWEIVSAQNRRNPMIDPGFFAMEDALQAGYQMDPIRMILQLQQEAQNLICFTT